MEGLGTFFPVSRTQCLIYVQWKKIGIENVRNGDGLYLCITSASFKILTHTHLLEMSMVEEEFPSPHSNFSLIITSQIYIILFILHSGAASINSSNS